MIILFDIAFFGILKNIPLLRWWLRDDLINSSRVFGIFFCFFPDDYLKTFFDEYFFNLGFWYDVCIEIVLWYPSTNFDAPIWLNSTSWICHLIHVDVGGHPPIRLRPPQLSVSIFQFV